MPGGVPFSGSRYLCQATVTATTLVILFGLIGCGGSSNTAGNNDNQSGGTPVIQPPPIPPKAQCPDITLQFAKGPDTGIAPFPDPAPVPPPSPGSTGNGSVCVSQPNDGADVSSPFHLVAAASLVNPIDHMRVFLDGVATQFTFYNKLDAQIFAAAGRHSVEILASDKNGNDVSTSFNVNVTGPGNATISDIQNIADWEFCTARFAPGHPRAGQICAAGLGDAQSTMTEGQKDPSLSGSSAHLTMGGSAAYSNALWTKFLGGSTNLTKFTYDLYFYIDKPDVAQALEFDVNQAFNNQRWVYGTECNQRADGVWDVWDGVNGWTPTKVKCGPFPANTWIHLVWHFERVGNQTHYISLTINDAVYPIDMYQSNEPKWVMESLDVAFQMDGDYQQAPYNVWIDKVTLTATE
jgi:hypothetical protein